MTDVDKFSTSTTATPKPGLKTTEFYGSWAVKILGALMASGVLGDGTTAARIAGAAIALLGYLGYTYSRAVVKTAAVLALFLSTTSCTGPQRVAAEHGVWNCLAPERAEVVDALTPLAASTLLAAASADGKLIDSSRVKSALSKTNLTSEGGVLLGCVIASAVTSLMVQPTGATAGAANLVVSRSALQHLWADVGLSGARFKTANGEL